ncbi:thioesterase family protein [Actinocrispum sp. NPDC049592]|uniref:acyl-CoA thioesterase n=1 Tax=Actinocrispum sp. NPDC049592 TaxID=3154835 RepID=UPI00341C3638
MFVHRLRVRYSECDQQGVVFNAHYLFYYDVALTELWRDQVVTYQEMTEKGDDLVVAESRLRYLRPGRFDDEIDIAMNVHHVGTTSLVIHPEFRVGGTLITEGEVRHVCVDPATMTKKPIPDYIRAGLTGRDQ